MGKLCKLCLALPKTFLFNFRALGVKKGIGLPIVLAPNVKLNWKNVRKGCINIKANAHFGEVNIGFYEGIGGGTSHRTVLDIRQEGSINFKGSACIAKGSYILVEKANITFGNNFHGGNNLRLIARDSISFGNNTLTAWDCTIMDSDGHTICDNDTNTIINESRPIIIEDNVWLGCNVCILKGTHIKENTVIGAGTLLSKKLEEGNSVYGLKNGSLTQIKKSVFWKQ